MSTEQMLLLSHSLLSLKGHGELKRCLRTGEKLVSLQSSKSKKEDSETTCWSASPSLCPGKVMEQLIMDVISKCVEEKIIKSSKHGFTRGSHVDCSESLLGWNDWLRRWGKAVGVVYLDFNKAFRTVSCNILIVSSDSVGRVCGQ